MNYSKFINEYKGEFIFNSEVDLSKIDVLDISDQKSKIKPKELLWLLSPRLNWKLNRLLFAMNLFKKFIK